MLHNEAIYPGTLGLLKNLMKVPELSDFNLVGGTAMALRIGHRISIDLDFFGNVGPLDHFLLQNIVSEYGQVESLTSIKNIYSVNVDNIKVDFVNYKYPLLEEPTVVEGVRLVSLQDISAMKLSAITGRGKKRDFIDLYFLMQLFPLKEILNFYGKKYHDGNAFLVLKSLTYFDDAEDDQDLVFLQKVDWEKVKETIRKESSKLF